VGVDSKLKKYKRHFILHTKISSHHSQTNYEVPLNSIIMQGGRKEKIFRESDRYTFYMLLRIDSEMRRSHTAFAETS